MSQYRADVLVAAAELAEGDSIYTTCPSCQREGKFSITRTDEGVLYHCFRASCTLKGMIGGSRSAFTRTAPPARDFTPFTGELVPLPQVWVDFMWENLGWGAAEHSLGRPMLAPELRRIAYPIRDPFGVRRGYSLRSYDKGVGTKSLTRMDMSAPHMSYYTCPNIRLSKHVLVVEDIPSAVRAAEYVNSVALCGTGCNGEYAAEIARKYDTVTWALDADATRQALRLQREHSIMFSKSNVLVLPCDLKNMGRDQLEEFLDGY